MTDSGRNKQLDLFRANVRVLVEAYAAQVRLFVAENVALGTPSETVRKMMFAPDSRVARHRETMTKLIKHEAAGMVNRIHIAAYTGMGI